MTALSIEQIRQALQHMHRYATGETTRPYMQIPANPQEDADLILSAAIDELEQLRGRLTLNQYQESAVRTLPHPTKDSQHELKVASMALGLTGEAGEVADYLKKVLWHGHELELTKLAKELGDVLWYLAAVAELHGLRLGDVAALNVAKLKARYPEGFSEAASKNRGPG